MNLVPINNNLLIELVDQYQYAATPDKEFSTKTSGYIRAGNKELDGKRVWFTSYQDDIKIDRDGKTYTFVKYEEVKGYEQD